MKCPECKAENQETSKFCQKCGSEILLACPQCGDRTLSVNDLCGSCGHTLIGNGSEKAAGPDDSSSPFAGGERKLVSILFSDLSGYTAMTEKLDPEEVREIMDRVFGEISQVVAKYDGFIEKFVGDSAMAVFGIPSAHEDDPIRAVRAAIEIHAQIKNVSSEVEEKIGRGSIISVIGNAGTGKSRLIRDFKARLNLKEVQWREGHAYPYTQNVPYYPLINLMAYAFRIQEGDNPETMKGKIEAGIKTLLWDRLEIVPYIGGLFSLSYPEIEEVNPEFLRTKLNESSLEILEALARRTPTVLLFEDLHWSDTSFINHLHLMLTRTNRPVMFILVYRPEFNLFPEGPPDDLNWPYHEIVLQDLSQTDSQQMLKSLLNADDLPAELLSFMGDQAEGNPFYLEEVVNSLIETGTLARETGGWSLTRPITEVSIPTTIQGVVTARVDRLEKEAKWILQEASVIGRAFFYEVLNRITQLNPPLDHYLTGLQNLDLIRTRTIEPDLEYIFKHALAQEVVYNGLLKKERHAIHERIGEVMEQLFADRLPEFYDVLAYHYKRGLSKDKAAEYLIKAGEKSYKTLSNQEANQYFHEAYDLLSAKVEKDVEDKALMMTLLFKWALLLYDFGEINKLIELFSAHVEMAESMDDKPNVCMFKAWLGFAYYMNGKPMNALKPLEQALKIAEELDDPKLIAYACSWLAWCNWDMGSAEKTINYGKKGYELSKQLSPHPYLDFKPLIAMGQQYFFEGRWKELKSIATRLLEKGEKTSNPRCFYMGQHFFGSVLFQVGKTDESIAYLQKAVEGSADVPFYRCWTMLSLGMNYVLTGQFEKAEKIMAEVTEFISARGIGALDAGLSLYGIAVFAQGRMNDGLKILREINDTAAKEQRKSLLLLAEFCMGNAFSQLVAPSEPVGLSVMMKNIGFLMKNLPGASKRAQWHFQRTIEVADETKSYLFSGMSWMELGRMFKVKKKRKKAQDCFEEAIKVYRLFENEFYIAQAEEALALLEEP